MMTVSAQDKPISFDAKLQHKLEVSASVSEWLAVRRACEFGQAEWQDDRKAALGPFLSKLADALLAPHPKIDEPGHGLGLNESNCVVSGKLLNWVAVADVILIWGDEDAKRVGHSIVRGCSQILFGRGA